VNQRAALGQVLVFAVLLFLLTRRRVWAWVVLLPVRLLWRLLTTRRTR
jgi:hypothetical protein